MYIMRFLILDVDYMYVRTDSSWNSFNL